MFSGKNLLKAVAAMAAAMVIWTVTFGWDRRGCSEFIERYDATTKSYKLFTVDGRHPLYIPPRTEIGTEAERTERLRRFLVCSEEVVSTKRTDCFEGFIETAGTEERGAEPDAQSEVKYYVFSNIGSAALDVHASVQREQEEPAIDLRAQEFGAAALLDTLFSGLLVITTRATGKDPEIIRSWEEVGYSGLEDVPLNGPVNYYVWQDDLWCYSLRAWKQGTAAGALVFQIQGSTSTSK